MRKVAIVGFISAVGLVAQGVAVQASETPATYPIHSITPHDSISSKVTVGQRNALAKAKEYLNYSSFSRKGLIEQLKYEGFSNADATYGADHAGANWNIQAYKKAKEYLNYSSFSRSGLLDQLIYEGFTNAQAQYGVKKAYR